MWDTNKQGRFSTLWKRKFSGILTQVEQTELEHLIDELDQLESEMLQPAFAHLDKERKQVAAQNTAIESLLKERQQLLQRTMDQIQQLLQEHIQLKAKTASIMKNADASGIVGSTTRTVTQFDGTVHCR